MSTNATVVQLLSDLISDFESSLSSWKGKPNVLLPSAAQFYRLGLILSDLFGQTEDIGQVYRKLLEKIPQSHLREVLEDLHEAFCKILESFLEQQENASSVTRENTELALKSMQGLYQTNAEFLLETATGNSVSGWSLKKIELLHSVYEKFAQLSGDHDATTTTTTTSTVEEHLLSLMSAFLLEPTLDFEQLLPAINLLQDKPDKYTKSAWEKLVILQSSSNSRQSKQWQDHMIRRFTEPEQQDYLKSMFIIEEEENPLSSNGVNSQTDRAPSDKVPSKRAPAVSQADTIQRLVQQVKTVFPHLGDGYIETALSHYHGDVERTMSALVEAQENPASLPVTLQRLDPKLPGRWKGPTSSQTQAEDEEARRVTQETVRAMERQQEEEARALEVLRVTSVPTHDEYNDDYDDQFDDIDGFMSNDHGLYDDYETVQTYNKMLKQVEEDQAFWDEMKNENRLQRKKSTKNGKKVNAHDANDVEEQQDPDHDNQQPDGNKYRGPDKIKGGRIPRPQQQQQREKVSNKKDTNNTSSNNNQGGRGGGRGGRGRGRGDANSNDNQTGGRGRGNARHKQNKLASRKDKQRQAMAKRAG